MHRAFLSFVAIFVLVLLILFAYTRLARLPRNIKLKIIISLIVAIIGTVAIFLLEVS